MIKLIIRTVFLALIMATTGSLKAQTLIAHFPLDSDGDSSDGNFMPSIVTDVEFGADGATSNKSKPFSAANGWARDGSIIPRS